jgi:hypothetical protein
VNGSAAALDKLREIVRHEFSAATEHSEAFVYFCDNEERFAPALPPEMLSARRAGVQLQAAPVIIAEDSRGILCIRA